VYGKWQRCVIPLCEPLTVVTPEAVARLIAWAVDGKGDISE